MSIRSLFGSETKPVRTTLSRSAILHLLSNDRRVAAIEAISESGETELASIAKQVAAAENGVPASMVSRQQRQRAYVALYQAHLPKLDEAGVIALGERGHQVTRGPEFDAVADLLETIDEQLEWSA